MKETCFYFCEKRDGKIDLIAIFLKFLKINCSFNVSSSEIK